MYLVWDMPRLPTGSVNSGVMLWHIVRMARGGGHLARAFFEGAAAVIRARVNLTGGEADYWALVKVFPLGDQDILNAMLAARPEWLYVLPPEYNACVDAPFPEDVAAIAEEKGLVPRAGATQGSRAPPCIIHFCGNRLMSPSGAEWLDVKDPVQASYMYTRFYPIEKPAEPPGIRPHT
jgi:hypothetical protein